MHEASLSTQATTSACRNLREELKQSGVTLRSRRFQAFILMASEKCFLGLALYAFVPLEGVKGGATLFQNCWITSTNETLIVSLWTHTADGPCYETLKQKRTERLHISVSVQVSQLICTFWPIFGRLWPSKKTCREGRNQRTPVIPEGK